MSPLDYIRQTPPPKHLDVNISNLASWEFKILPPQLEGEYQQALLKKTFPIFLQLYMLIVSQDVFSLTFLDLVLGIFASKLVYI